jgi:hypothetical protein
MDLQLPTEYDLTVNHLERMPDVVIQMILNSLSFPERWKLGAASKSWRSQRDRLLPKLALIRSHWKNKLKQPVIMNEDGYGVTSYYYLMRSNARDPLSAGVHPLFDPSAQAALFHARQAARGMGEDIPEQATGGDLEELLDEIKGNLNQPEHAGITWGDVYQRGTAQTTGDFGPVITMADRGRDPFGVRKYVSPKHRPGGARVQLIAGGPLVPTGTRVPFMNYSGHGGDPRRKIRFGDDGYLN